MVCRLGDGLCHRWSHVLYFSLILGTGKEFYLSGSRQKVMIRVIKQRLLKIPVSISMNKRGSIPTATPLSGLWRWHQTLEIDTIRILMINTEVLVLITGSNPHCPSITRM